MQIGFNSSTQCESRSVDDKALGSALSIDLLKHRAQFGQGKVHRADSCGRVVSVQVSSSSSQSSRSLKETLSSLKDLEKRKRAGTGAPQGHIDRDRSSN